MPVGHHRDAVGYSERPRSVRPRNQGNAYGQNNGDVDVDFVESSNNNTYAQAECLDERDLWTAGLDNESDYDIEMDAEYDVSSKTSHEPMAAVQMPDIAAMVIPKRLTDDQITGRDRM